MRSSVVELVLANVGPAISQRRSSYRAPPVNFINVFGGGRRGGEANIALARKSLGVIYHTLKNNWVFEDFPNFVLAS